jgi:CubicO group peptidase (beta-lactamase class C family)
MANPYADFGVDDLVRWAARFRPRRPPAEGAFAYSVVGMGLLGYVLEEINRARLDVLFADEIFAPLGLKDTVYRCNTDQEARLATPHGRGKPVAVWTYGGLAGAGGLLSSAADIARLIAAVLKAPSRDDVLGKAIADTLEIRRRPRQADGEGGGLGWTVLRASKPPAFIYTDAGRTNGSQALIAVAPQPGLGAAVLVNAGPRARDAMNPPRRQLIKTFTMAWAELPAARD